MIKNISMSVPFQTISVISLSGQLPDTTDIAKSEIPRKYSQKARKRKSNELMMIIYKTDRQHALIGLHLLNETRAMTNNTIPIDSVA
jgi:hypothetical protein